MMETSVQGRGDPTAGRDWLIIAARNFGDALILARLIEVLQDSFPADRFSVWTRPRLRPLFEGLPRPVQVTESSFPMGSVKEIDLKEAACLAFETIRLRRRRFDFCFNFTGDVRENFLGWGTGALCNVAPVWDKSCSLGIQNRVGGYRWVHHVLRVPADRVNVYEIRAWVAEALGCPRGAMARVEARRRDAPRPTKAGLIGIHPFTTMDHKRWTWESWGALVRAMAAQGLRARFFCTPGEVDILRRELPGLVPSEHVETHAGTLADFAAGLREVEVVVGLDSFVMHMAYDLGTPAVLINGSFDPRLAAPPGTRVLSNAAACPRHPCHQFPVCRKVGMSDFACIRRISPEQVLAEVLAARSPAEHAVAG